MTTFRVDPKDPSKLIKQYEWATSSTGLSTVKALNLAPRGPNGEILVQLKSQDEVIANVPGIDPTAEPEVDIGVDDPGILRALVDQERRAEWESEPEMDSLLGPDPANVNLLRTAKAFWEPGAEQIPARETMWKQSRGVTVSLPKQEHSFRRIKDGRNLLGGENDYVYYGNSRDRGTFAKYPGISKRYNTNPNTNETMARLAIPISGDVDAFILKTFGSDPHMTRLSKAIMTNGNSGLGYIDFLLQNIQESFSEKAQISETVGDNYVAFFFGSAPPVFVFSGQLLNTFQDEWRTSMHLLYQNLLRGTKLARNKQLVSIYYDQIIANGYIMSHNQNYAAEMQMASSFSFQMLIKSITFFRLPLTLPTMPSKLPRNISFQNVFGMEREAIRRSTRTVGVVNAESAPSKVEPEIKPEITPAGPQKGTEAYRQAYRQLIRQSHRRHDTTPFSPAEQQKRKEVYRLPVLEIK